MKYTFIVAVLVVLSSCSSKLIPNEIQNGKILGVTPVQYSRGSYQYTKHLRASREEIFRQSRRWAAFHFYDPSRSFAVSDNMLGDVIASGHMNSDYLKVKSNTYVLPPVDYSFSIECNEGRYRVTMTNIKVMYTPTTPYGIEVRPSTINEKRMKAILSRIDSVIQNMVDDLETFVPEESKGK